MKHGEVYYKFIFPNYNKLSGYNKPEKYGTDENPKKLESDGDDQTGEVLTLCRKCPERVITYDQLTAANPVSIYTNGTNGWTSTKKAAIKNFVDYWKNLPKYFNLRNYWDHDPPQAGGMSLIVSHSPEVGLTSTGWTKFNSSDIQGYAGESKIVYCSLMVSSGDFFYSFCLPDEIIAKSELKNEIVTNKFHLNWYFLNNAAKNVWRTIPRAVHFNNSDKFFYDNDHNKTYIKDDNYPGYPYADLYHFNEPSLVNPGTGYERRVFSQAYFHDFFQCAPQIKNGKVIQAPGDFQEDLKHDFLDLEATRRILYYDDTNNSNTQLKYTKNNITHYITIQPTSDIPILLDDYEFNINLPSDYFQGLAWWRDDKDQTPETPENVNTIMNKPITINTYNNTTNSWEAKTVYTGKRFSDDNCKCLRDMTKQIVTYLREKLPKIGKNTRISYEPPAVYDIDRGGCPPLQIPYNLLRYCLNDRPPFTDCETVLVMWVATPYRDSNNNLVTPDTISNGDVASLHKLNWQQYAIPISMRCCYKNVDSSITENKKHCNKRFLVSYPCYLNKPGVLYNYKYSGTISDCNDYQAHFQFNETYKKNVFREALYTKDLVDYSQDYVITFHINKSTFNNIFNIQKFMFNKLGDNSCKALYIRKKYIPDMKCSYNNETGRWVWGIGDFGALSNRYTASQAYYLYVPERLYSINHNNNDYIRNKNQTEGPFIPTKAEDPNDNYALYFRKENFIKWDFAYENNGLGPARIKNSANENRDPVEQCAVHDDYFIALFNADSTQQNITQVKGELYIDNADLLNSYLKQIIPPRYTGDLNKSNAFDNWDDLYITSIGISPYNIYDDSCFKHNTAVRNYDDLHIYPLGLLNNYIKIKIDGTNTYKTYGTNYNKVIVGFKKMYDYQYNDMYHFRYNATTHTYDPVQVIFNFNTCEYPTNNIGINPPIVTAYVMNYP